MCAILFWCPLFSPNVASFKYPLQVIKKKFYSHKTLNNFFYKGCCMNYKVIEICFSALPAIFPPFLLNLCTAYELAFWVINCCDNVVLWSVLNTWNAKQNVIWFYMYFSLPATYSFDQIWLFNTIKLVILSQNKLIQCAA